MRQDPGEGSRALGFLPAWLPGLLLALCIVDWVGLKSGAISHPHGILAALVGVSALSVVIRVAQVTAGARRGRRRPGIAAGEILVLGGVLLALGAGTANWLLSLQGFVVLHEGEAVPLHDGSHLQEIEMGPLARRTEMHWMLALREVELLPTGDGFFYPRSVLEVRRGEEGPRALAIDSRNSAEVGSLRFHQGAFGFAPRIVILRNGEMVFDRVVPLTTERRGPAGITFSGEFTLAAEALELSTTVELKSLDEQMRGHATLFVEVRRDETVLGRGRLLPGHFADVEDGYRVGFVDLEKWVEIDVSRRHYGEWVLAGGGLISVGAVFWLLAAWRGW